MVLKLFTVKLHVDMKVLVWQMYTLYHIEKIPIGKGPCQEMKFNKESLKNKLEKISVCISWKGRVESDQNTLTTIQWLCAINWIVHYHYVM